MTREIDPIKQSLTNPPHVIGSYAIDRELTAPTASPEAIRRSEDARTRREATIAQERAALAREDDARQAAADRQRLADENEALTSYLLDQWCELPGRNAQTFPANVDRLRAAFEAEVLAGRKDPSALLTPYWERIQTKRATARRVADGEANAKAQAAAEEERQKRIAAEDEATNERIAQMKAHYAAREGQRSVTIPLDQYRVTG